MVQWVSRRPYPQGLLQLPAPLVGPLAATVQTGNLPGMSVNKNINVLKVIDLKIAFEIGLIASSAKKLNAVLSLSTFCSLARDC